MAEIGVTMAVVVAGDEVGSSITIITTTAIGTTGIGRTIEIGIRDITGTGTATTIEITTIETTTIGTTRIEDTRGALERMDSARSRKQQKRMFGVKCSFVS